MSKLAALIREPAVLIDAFESLIVMLVALGLFDLSGDTQTNVIAAFIALLAVLKGFLTQPFPVTVIPDFGRAALVLCVSLGILHVTADTITIIATFLGTAMSLVMRSQITPRYDPVIQPGGAGAGPVGSERGAIGYNSPYVMVGLVLILVGIALLLLTTLYVVSVILIVVGIVVLIIGLTRTGAGRHV